MRHGGVVGEGWTLVRWMLALTHGESEHCGRDSEACTGSEMLLLI